MTRERPGMTDRRNATGRTVAAKRRDLAPLAPLAEAPGGNLNQRVQASDPRRRAAESRPVPGEAGPPPAERRDARVAARRGTVGRGDAEFHPGTLAIDEVPRSPIHWLVVFWIVALLAAALAWAYFGRFASYTAAAGKIQTTGRTNVLEALATGKVVKILGRDGDAVKAGTVLVELDPTDAQAARTILDQQLTDRRAETLRLRSEIANARAETIDPRAKIPWGKDVPAAVRKREDGVARADLARLAAQIATLLSQKHAKEAERDKFAKNIEAQKALVAITQENMTMIDSLTKRGFNSQAKYLDMKAQLDGQQVTQTNYEGSLENAKQAILIIDSEVAKTREAFVATATQTVSTNEQTIVDLAQRLVKADQMLSNMTLHAPVTGVVHASGVTTIGQVVKPRQQLMQIVPRDSPLEIQAYVANTDIGFIRKDDPATIKLTAFTYNVYGSIDGTVTDVANDALALQGKAAVQTSSLDGEYQATTDAQKTGNLQFPVTVRAARSTMTVEGKEIPLVPGMGVSIEILTENRRAIDYIVSPLEELFSTAGHER